jgi:hypothetical protein
MLEDTTQTTDTPEVLSTDEWDQMTEETFEELKDEFRHLNQPELVERVDKLHEDWRKQKSLFDVLNRGLHPTFIRETPPIDMAYYQRRLDTGYDLAQRSGAPHG